MNRRDLISAIMGLPAMAGIKAIPLVPGEAVDSEVPSAGATKGAEPPFVIVLQPDRLLPKEAIVRIREQMTEFLDSAGVNAKAAVLPHGVSIKTVTPDGVVHGGVPEAPPDTKPWCGQLVYAWAMMPTIYRRSFDVVEVPHGHRLCLRTEFDGEKYDTAADVSITVNNEVCPHEAMWLVNQHEKNFNLHRQAAVMKRTMKLASPKREST